VRGSAVAQRRGEVRRQLAGERHQAGGCIQPALLAAVDRGIGPWPNRLALPPAFILPPIIAPRRLSRSDFFMLMVRRPSSSDPMIVACLWHSLPMAQKATVCKASLRIADIDRGLYATIS
jgi:hypothetical protein